MPVASRRDRAARRSLAVNCRRGRLSCRRACGHRSVVLDVRAQTFRRGAGRPVSLSHSAMRRISRFHPASGRSLRRGRCWVAPWRCAGSSSSTRSAGDRTKSCSRSRCRDGLRATNTFFVGAAGAKRAANIRCWLSLIFLMPRARLSLHPRVREVRSRQNRLPPKATS